jgi:hypothetical protein
MNTTTKLFFAASAGYNNLTVAVASVSNATTAISQLARNPFRKTQAVKPATTQVDKELSPSTGKASKTFRFSDVDVVHKYRRNKLSTEARVLFYQQRIAREKVGKANKKTHDEVWDGLKMCTRITDLDCDELKTLEDKTAQFRKQGLEVTKVRDQASEVTKVSSQRIFFYFDTRTEGEIFLCNPDDAERFWQHPIIALCVEYGDIQRDSKNCCKGQWLGDLELGNKVKGWVKKQPFA